jgi:hypothetical protein
MVKFLLLAAVLLGGAAIALSQREGPASATGACAPASPGVSGPESQLLSGINAWRAGALGQPAMANSAPANAAAQTLAESIIAGTGNGHIDSHGSWGNRLLDCGYPTEFFPLQSAGEAVAVFTSSGATASDAIADMTSLSPNHQSGVQAPVPWECSGVGYASGGTGSFKSAWVVVVASAPSAASCPQVVSGGGASPTTSSSATAKATATATAKATATPTRAIRFLPMVTVD